ncbi:hypothetical protein BASA81_000995 [Batrachochytrium salamandrivorans]|nr:hypothetical protein BASA81_000995 [Batrachochytrium salamandrivorans]
MGSCLFKRQVDFEQPLVDPAYYYDDESKSMEMDVERIPFSPRSALRRRFSNYEEEDLRFGISPSFDHKRFRTSRSHVLN